VVASAPPCELAIRTLLHTRMSKTIEAAVASIVLDQAVACLTWAKGVSGVIELRQEITGIGRIFIPAPRVTPSAGYLASVAASVTGPDARELITADGQGPAQLAGRPIPRRAILGQSHNRQRPPLANGGCAGQRSDAGRPRWLDLGEVLEALVVGVGGVGEVGGL